MKYWQNIISKEIVQAEVSPNHGWLWVEIFCSCVDSLHPGDDPKCPVHAVKK
jgi:hypothetical protein